MGKTIQVTSAQVNAARLWIERAEDEGTEVPKAIRKLADAMPRPVIRDEPNPNDAAEDTADGSAAEWVAATNDEDHT